MAKNFQVYFILHMNFFKKPNKTIYNRAKELYCDATIFVFDSLLSTCPNKMETEKWPKAADSPLLNTILAIRQLVYYHVSIAFRRRFEHKLFPTLHVLVQNS